MSQNPEGPPGSEAGDDSVQKFRDELARVRAGGTSNHFGVNFMAARDPNEPGAITTGFNEVMGGLRERLVLRNKVTGMERAVDKAGFMFSDEIGANGKPTGELVLVPKPPSPPQDLVDLV